jgi:hypothetical protein
MATQPRAADSLTFPADGIRPSDAERDEVIARLRECAEQGRLDVDELSTRLDRVYAAGARHALAALLDDLPGDPRPSVAPSPVSPPAFERGYPGLLTRAGGYVAVSLLLVAIWALTGAGGFWPVWFIAFGAFGVFGKPRRHGHCGGHRRRHREATHSL